jgi:hypothetical protein
MTTRRNVERKVETLENVEEASESFGVHELIDDAYTWHIRFEDADKYILEVGYGGDGEPSYCGRGRLRRLLKPVDDDGVFGAVVEAAEAGGEL